MPDWKPIATLTERKPCTDYLVALRSGSVRLLWWDEDDRTWTPDNDREDDIAESEVVLWYDLPTPYVNT